MKCEVGVWTPIFNVPGLSHQECSAETDLQSVLTLIEDSYLCWNKSGFLLLYILLKLYFFCLTNHFRSRRNVFSTFHQITFQDCDVGWSCIRAKWKQEKKQTPKQTIENRWKDFAFQKYKYTKQKRTAIKTNQITKNSTTTVKIACERNNSNYQIQSNPTQRRLFSSLYYIICFIDVIITMATRCRLTRSHNCGL